MRTRRDLLAGLGAAIALAGCTGNGGEGGTTAPDTTTTTGTPTEPAPDDTTTPENTPEETPTDTSGDTPEETPTPTPEPDPKSFDEIYQEEMVHYSGVGQIIDWNDVKNELENEHGHDLANLEVNSRFIEDLASHIDNRVGTHQAAEGLAYGLYEEFDVGTNQVIVDARTANDGTQGHMTSILIKQSDGGVVKDTDLPIDSDPLEEGNPGYKRHDENTNLSKTEQSLKDIWNADEHGLLSWLDREGIVSWAESDSSPDYITRDGQEMIAGDDDDVAIGYHSEEGMGRMAFTEEAFRQMSNIIDPSEINSDPQGTGVEAWNFVKDVSTFYHNHEDEYIEVDFDGEEFQYDTVSESRHEELVHDILDEYVE